MEERVSTDVKLNFKQKLQYCIGDCGYNLIYFWVSSYLLIFYTDVFKISAAAVTTLMVVVRVFDAVNDPLIGSLADRTKQKTGTYKRWIQWGSFMLGVSTVFLFWAHPGWSGSEKLIYVYVTYCIVVCASTATNMPYGVAMGMITTDALERSKISRLRFACVFLGNMGVVAAAPLVLKGFSQSFGNEKYAYVLSVALFCLTAVPMLWTAAFKSKEVVQIPKNLPKVTMSQRFKSLKSRPILVVIAAFLFHGFTYYGRAAIYPYYFKYYCKSGGLNVQFGVVLGIANVIGTLFAPAIHKRLKHKGRAMALEVLIFALTTLATFWFTPITHFWMFYLLNFIGGIAMGAYMTMIYAMAPDAIDYSYYHSSVHASGFLYSFTSFACKVGGALAPVMIAVVNDALGYVPEMTQSSQVLLGMRCMMSIVPGIVSIIFGLVVMLYPLSDKRYNDIKRKLHERTESEL